MTLSDAARDGARAAAPGGLARTVDAVLNEPWFRETVARRVEP